MRKLLAGFLLVTAGTTGVASARDCSRERPTAFVDVTLIKPETDLALPNQTVVVRCERIVAVGPSAMVRAPRGAVVVAGRGQFLSPGLVDAHMHLGDDPSDLSVWLSQGVTSVRSLDGVPARVAWREHVKACEGGEYLPSSCWPKLRHYPKVEQR